MPSSSTSKIRVAPPAVGWTNGEMGTPTDTHMDAGKRYVALHVKRLWCLCGSNTCTMHASMSAYWLRCRQQEAYVQYGTM